MDGPRFDRIARAFASRVTRRALGVAAIVAAPAISQLESPSPALADRCTVPRNTMCGKKCVSIKNNRQHCGRCHKRCPARTICKRGRCKPVVIKPCGVDAPCLVFVSSTSQTGKLGGLAGADAICMSLAKKARLRGTYMAWLSDSQDSPSNRFPTKSTTGYALLNGTVVTNGWIGTPIPLTLLSAINLTEKGGSSGGAWVWTGTQFNGIPLAPYCNDWTSDANTDAAIVGSSNGTFLEWTMGGYHPCNDLRPLYCFQQTLN